MKPARIAIRYIETDGMRAFVRKCLENGCTEKIQELEHYWRIADEVCSRVMDAPI